jgi:L-rhamnose mutarotase
LDADAWIRAIEAMFAVFTLPCSEGRKAKFAALQLHGSTLIWWEHYKSMQQPEYEITWEEFKKAFRDHHLPKALTDRKMRELLALKQGSYTVYQYAQKFNNLFQYGGYHVDTDMKKMEGRGCHNWLTRRQLVFDVYVEQYAAYRVMRQFGLFQAAPVPAAPRLPPSAHR